MGKKRKHEHSGKTSTPRDELPLEGSSDTFPSSVCDVLIQFKDIIQVKVNTDELLQELKQTVKKLEEKVKKLEEKVKRNKSKEAHKKVPMNKIKEDLKRELIEEFKDDKQDLMRELIAEFKDDKKDLIRELIDEFKEELKLELQDEMKHFENKSKEYFSVFKEDFKKELEVKEEPDLIIQEVMRKEGCAKVHHGNTSPSLRSQPQQSQRTSFHLAIKCTMSSIVFKGKPIRTDDSDHIEVVLYDGGNLIAPDHYLASAEVELVVVDGDFGEHPQEYWSKDDFEQKIMKPRQGNNQKLVKSGKFKMVGGRYRCKGVIIMENSNRKDVKLGVMMVGETEERVLEGVSNIFRVQEAKTDKDRVKRITDDTSEELPRHTGHTFSHLTNRNEQSQQYSLPTTRPNLLNKVNPSHIAYAQTARHGSAGPLPVNGLLQQGTIQLENRAGQAQQYRLPTAGRSNFLNMQNPSQITYAHTAANGSVGPLTVDHLQYTTQLGTTQLESYGPSIQICTSSSTGDVFDPLGEVLRRFAPGRGRSADHLAAPGTLEHSGYLHQTVAADPGGNSAGTQHSGISQLPLPHPQTEDAYQDGAAILSAPRTAAQATEGTQMDFTQAMAPWDL